MTRPSRALMPDYLRLIALFGIVVVNVQFIGFSLLSSLVIPVAQTRAELVTLWLVDGLALYKSYSLFSFMFGVGLGFLMRSAERKGQAFAKLYRNRMIGLFVLGVLHGCLFFPGDILLVYSVMGSVLYIMRNWRPGRLAKMGAVLVILPTLVFASLMTTPGDIPEDIAALEREAMTSGSLLGAFAFRSVAYAIMTPFVLFLQGSAALGWFCLGLAAVKSGLIDKSDDPMWARARRWCLVPGVTASLLASWLLHAQGMIAASAVLPLVAPVATLGYLGGIAAISRPPGPILSRVLAAGGSSLSVYLGQSIILSTLFSGYGFGLWGAVPRPQVVLIAIAVTVGLILALAIWRSVFRLGPFEWLLRRITYAGQPKIPPA